MMRVVVVVMVVGCTKNEPKPVAPGPATPLTSEAAQPAADPAPCDQAVEHMIKISRTTGDTKPLNEMMRRHCADDLWSLEARKCYLLANSWDEGLACESKLSAAQVKSLEDDIKAQGSTMAHPPPQR